jgi:hypothetical protein
MRRKLSLVLLLCVLLAALSGCASPELFDTATQAPPGYGRTTPDPVAEIPVDNTEEYVGDPEGEEGVGDLTEEDLPVDVPSEDSSSSAFAGSTPIPLDPIDMPTGTPRPKLAFEYQTYEATKLGLTFDGPIGWIVDDTQSDTYILTEPEDQRKDNYSAFIIIKKTPVNQQYNMSDLKNEVKGMLDTIGATNFTKFEPAISSDRTLMEHDGMYDDYAGTLVDGTRVRGRVQVTCIDKVLYSIHMAHPANYNSDYLKNHGKIRETMKLTK